MFSNFLVAREHLVARTHWIRNSIDIYGQIFILGFAILNETKAKPQRSGNR